MIISALWEHFSSFPSYMEVSSWTSGLQICQECIIYKSIIYQISGRVIGFHSPWNTVLYRFQNLPPSYVSHDLHKIATKRTADAGSRCPVVHLQRFGNKVHPREPARGRYG